MAPIIHSKPVIYKEDKKTRPPVLEIWYWIEATRVYSVVYGFVCQLRRSWAYAKFGWGNYDFDGSFALDLLSFKLKRLQRVLVSGHLEQDKTTLQSLRLAIRLLDKLSKDRYDYFIDRHNLKWYNTKSPEFGFEDTADDADCCRMVFPSEALPEDQQAQENDEHRAAWHNDEALKARDKRWAFSIIEKYYEHWWD